MKWTPKDPVCEMCIDAHSNGSRGVSNSGSSTSRSVPMQVQTIIGNSWKMRKVEA
jgi:hypothetical protein